MCGSGIVVVWWDSQTQTQTTPHPSPRLLTKTQQCPPYHPSHHSKSKRWHPAPQPPQDSTLLLPPAQPFKEQPTQGHTAPEGARHAPKFPPPLVGQH